MCGLTGLVAPSRFREEQLNELACAMADSLMHRGPDDRGTWVDARHGVALGFRRLAIQDLTQAGHQPMTSASGRFVIVFNGEVYNFPDIRHELEQHGATFRGGSDTEVILASFERWGIRASLPRFIGMFAMAVWDTEQATITLVRDRMGIKPMHVAKRPGLLAFGSEIRALLHVPGIEPELDRGAAAAFLRNLSVPAPSSIIAGITKLLPGHLLEYHPASDRMSIEAWWDIRSVAANAIANPFDGSTDDAVDALDLLLQDSVSRRMIADVPLGAFLSAGVDSSTVVALMQAASSRPVRTFSIAFDHREHDESRQAAAIADYLGTNHEEILLSGARALDVVPQLADILDEPHADTSQIPVYLLCAAARREVTVALSGDGGDEVFGGYNRYTYGERVINRALRIPSVARRPLGYMLGAVSPGSWDRSLTTLARVAPFMPSHRLAGEKMLKLSRLLQSGDEAGMYQALASAWLEPNPMGGATSTTTERSDLMLADRAFGDLYNRMLLADQLTYLPDDQLGKVDRMSMAVSLEVRVPLVDHRVVEFAWSLPRDLKWRDGMGKWILRRVLARRLPPHLLKGPKMGLSVPLFEWLTGPLRPWAEDLLTAQSLETDGQLDPKPVRDAWTRLLHGRSEYALRIWAVLMLQSWARRWLGAATP